MLAIVAAQAAVIFSAAAEPGFPVVVRHFDPEISSAGGARRAGSSLDGQLLVGYRQMLAYDGERWKTASFDEGWGVRGLESLPDGRVWAVGFGDMGWFDKSAGEWHFHSIKSKLPPEHVGFVDYWSAFAYGNGAIFVGSDRVLRWDGNTFSSWMLPGYRRLWGHRIGADIYIHQPNVGLLRMTPSGPDLVLPIATLGESPIFYMDRVSTGIRLVRNDGVYLWNNDGVKLVQSEITEKIRRQQLKLTAGCLLPDGRVALGTSTAGVILMAPDGSVDSILDKAAGITEGYIPVLYSDGRGSLWLAGDSSLFQVHTSNTTRIFDQRSALAGLQIARLAQDEGKIVFVSYDGVITLSPDRTNFTHLAETGEPVNDARGTPDGLLIGSLRGLVRQKGGITTSLRSGKDVYLLAPSRTHPERVLVGEARDIFEIKTDSGEAELLVRGLGDSVTSMGDDLEQGVWLGTYASGILYADRTSGGSARAVPERAGLPAGKGISFVATSPTGGVYAFNSKGGWYRAPGARRFVAIANFPQATIAALASDFDQNGNLWAVTLPSGIYHAGVGRISLRAGVPTWEPHSVDGLPNIGSPRSIRTEMLSGLSLALWIGGTNGALRNVIDGPLQTPRPPAPVVRAAVNADKGNSLLPLGASVPYSTRAIEFELSELDFLRRDQLRLETRIDGLDSDWIPAAADSRRTLSGLREGHFTFRARAVAETGATSPETTIAFAVAPPWWRTIPAAVAVAVALAPAGYGLYWLRLRRLRRRNAELEEKVRDRTDQLERASAAKTEFVANMSHDIRNPLNGIVGLSYALEDTRLDARQRDLVSNLRDCTNYLSTLVDDVLDFASIEAGKVELRPAPFKPIDLLRAVVTTLQSDTAERGAALQIEIDPAVPGVLIGDAGRIQQILVNYASNALKYAGGRIDLIATLPLGAGDEVEFSVADHGQGISEADQAQLFLKFGRLSGARNADIPGTGLGLASCRALADVMGGSVGVESQPGQGARFYLRLPLAAATAPASPAINDISNNAVLLVEDTDYNALAASAVLARLGLSCERARSGEEALTLFAAKRHNLVLLDRNLPDLDGLEVARRLRALEPPQARSVVLAVTAYCTAEDRRLCLEAGMDAFVGKPLTPDKLRRALLSCRERLLPAGDFESSLPGLSFDAPSSVLDIKLLSYLSDGSAQGLQEQVDRYIAFLDDAQKQLTAAHSIRDFAAVALWAHRLLGQARMVDGVALVETSVQLEAAALRGDLNACHGLLPAVTREVEAITAALRRDRPSVLPA